MKAKQLTNDILGVILAVIVFSAISSFMRNVSSQSLSTKIPPTTYMVKPMTSIPYVRPKSKPKQNDFVDKALNKLDSLENNLKDLSSYRDKIEQENAREKRAALKRLYEAQSIESKRRYDSLVVAEQNELGAIPAKDSIVIPSPCLSLPEVSPEIAKKRGFLYNIFH